VEATSAEVTVKGATFLTGDTAQQRQREIKEATKATQQTSSAGVVRVVRPRVFWMGVFREGEATRWPESSVVRQLEGKFVERVNAKLVDLKPTAIDLRTANNGDSPSSTDGLVALLALSSESRFWYPDPVVQASNRVVVRLTGQLLFIDSLAGRVAAGDLNRVGWQVVASYPIAVDMQSLSETQPGPDDNVWQRVTSEALMGAQRTPDGRALSVLDQLTDQLKSDAIAPRRCSASSRSRRVWPSPRPRRCGSGRTNSAPVSPASSLPGPAFTLALTSPAEAARFFSPPS
jgi:hypothetical protein